MIDLLTFSLFGIVCFCLGAGYMELRRIRTFGY